ncbi:MAG: M3 family oligoendopeptidase, partial [Nitrososphaerales archaeon]
MCTAINMTYTSLKVGSWKLTELAKNASGDGFQRFLASIEELAKQFETKRKELRADISLVDFENLIHLTEEISEKVSMASSYAHLQYYANTSSNEAAALVTKMEKLASDIRNRLLFFDLWFEKEIDDTNAQRLINAIPPVYREYLRHKRLFAKHALTEPEEKIINTLNVTGTRALVKIYDKMTNTFEFTMTVKKGKKTITKMFNNKQEMLSYIRSPKAEEREGAYKALWNVYRKNSGILGEIYSNIVTKWRDEGISMRAYKSPISIRNLENDLDDRTVEVLLKVCRRNSAIFQDYFREKAKMIGVKKLRRYDLYAPLSSGTVNRKKFTYGRAVDTVLKTFEDFDPQLRKFAERVFDEEHVDSA